MAREIINDLANIIREHQKTLPNIEKLDVDDKFRATSSKIKYISLILKNHFDVQEYLLYKVGNP